MSKKPIKTVIIGNPNSGKTTLFNALTGDTQRVGNWPGVTVEKKMGYFWIQQQKVELVDLPGIYSLNFSNQTQSIDERIATNYISTAIQEKSIDFVINVVDAANLKRHLYLSYQLLELGVPCILVLNMMDIAKQRKILIDVAALSQALSIPVIPVVGVKHQGLPALKQALIQAPLSPDPAFFFSAFPDNYHGVLTALRQQIAYTLDAFPVEALLMERTAAAQASQQSMPSLHAQALANTLLLDVFENNGRLQKFIVDSQLQKKLAEIFQTWQLAQEEDIDILMAERRYKNISRILQQINKTATIAPKKHYLTDALDKLLLNKYLGLPCFFIIMYFMFEFSMNLGTALSPLFDDLSALIFVDGFQYLGQLWHWPLWLTQLMSQGLGLGINTILTFIPQIACMFLCLSFLEDSGYMIRAAFVMDRLMQMLGLPGKSFIPLIMGFGCNVPAIMATRTLERTRDRLLTILMTPFMSCGARLAIFVVFAAAFFPQDPALILFLLYTIGIFVALLTGFIFKRVLFKGESTPFLMELPLYHLPQLKTILRLTIQRSKGFVIRAGYYILPICLLLSVLNTFTWSGQVLSTVNAKSILASLSQWLVPLLSPMGIDPSNWAAAVGLITGFLAKEVVVGTLNTLYTHQMHLITSLTDYHFWVNFMQILNTTKDNLMQLFTASHLNPFTANEAEHVMSSSAMGNMQAAFHSPLAAFSYLLFVLLYVPCISTVAVIAREMGKRWAIVSSIWSLCIAYAAAVTFYQLASFFAHPAFSALMISSMLALILSFVFFIKWQKNTLFSYDLITEQGLPATKAPCHW